MGPMLAYFHLLSHAFFKAILFICAGIIIHNIKDYQDIRKMGLSKGFIPIVTSVIMVANIRLCGLPFLRGFYSKDLILEMIIIKGINFLIISIMLVGTFLTVAYSCRIRFLVGLNLNKSQRYIYIIRYSFIIPRISCRRNKIILKYFFFLKCNLFTPLNKNIYYYLHYFCYYYYIFILC